MAKCFDCAVELGTKFKLGVRKVFGHHLPIASDMSGHHAGSMVAQNSGAFTSVPVCESSCKPTEAAAPVVAPIAEPAPEQHEWPVVSTGPEEHHDGETLG